MKHPCFDKAHDYGRIHLPVAKKCNLGCNFCNRKYDCFNESRPGVTSRVLSPKEAVIKTIFYKENMENLSVVGISGPGDPLANIKETKTTLTILKKLYPELKLCLSTNGVNLLESIGWLSEIGVGYVTVTVNALIPEIAEKIYSFVVKDGRVYKGMEMAELLVELQKKGVEELVARGFKVKINTVCIPGINDNHVVDIGRFFRKLGISLFNVIPLIPVEGTVFWRKGLRKPPEKKEFLNIQTVLASEGLNVMTHCKTCRADAVGKLSGETEKNRSLIAVTSLNGEKVDSHFGSFKRLYLFDSFTGEFCGVRDIEGTYNSIFFNDFESLKSVLGVLKDCSVLVTKKVGGFPKCLLSELGISVIETGESVMATVSSLTSKSFLNSLSCFEYCGFGGIQ